MSCYSVLAYEQCLEVSIKSLSITNSRRRTVLNLAPNAYPAARIIAKRDIGDETPVEFIQVGDGTA